MDENNRNFLLAIVLSLAVLVSWQYFFAGPRMEEQRARQQAEKARQAPAGPQSRPTATTPGVPGPGAAPEGPSPGVSPVPAGATRQQILAASPRVQIDTPRLKGSIALVGGRIDDLVLKDYRKTVKPDSENVVLLSPSAGPGAYYAEFGWIGDGSSKLKLPARDTPWKAQSAGVLKPGSPVTLVWDNGEGLNFRRTISVDENYMFTVRQEVENTGQTAVTLHPYSLVSRHETPHLESFYILHEGLVGVLGEKGLQEVDYDDAIADKTTAFKDVTGGWLGITDKYWATAVIPNQERSYHASFTGSQEEGHERYQADYVLGPIAVQPGAKASVEGHLFAGAKQVDLVEGYAERFGIGKFDLLIDWGWFRFLTKPLFFALDYFYKLVGNFGLSILIVTILIKLVLFPLANKSYVSMSKMKKLQPEMQRIKERFENDKTRQQQAMMDLYKNEKVNPASGCLPILIQIPVFFALYKVLFITIEMRHAPFYGWIQDLSAPDPTTLFNLFGLIPWDPPTFLHIGVWPLIMGFTMFIQMRLNPAPPDPVQAKVFAWMPVIFTFLLATFPAGLVIYWAWNNLLSVLQQAFIMHRQGAEIALFDNLGFGGKKKQAGGRSKS